MSALNRARPRATLDARAASTSESLVSLHRRILIASIAAALVGAPCAAQEPANADSPRVLDVLTAEAQQVLLEADRFEVMAIECERRPDPGEDALLEQYPVERRDAVPSREDRVRLLSRIYQGIDEGTTPATCFLPHHAVRATRGEQFVELIICFMCHQMIAYGTGVRPPREGSRYVVISRAAAEELGRLIGPLDWQRRVAGKQLDGWWSRLADIARRKAAIEPDDEVGVVAVAEALGWGRPRTVHESAEALRALGPAAAPALPTLRRHVEADLSAPACRAALSVIETIGPAAAPAVLGVITRLREALAVKADRVAEAAVRALGGIGPAAADAAPWLEPLAMRDDDLGRAATDALRRIRVEPR